MTKTVPHGKECVFMLDCARKYFTPDWIKRLIDEIGAVGFNAINIHFSESNGFRLESKRYPWLAGGDHTLCGFGAEYGCPEHDHCYLTQEEMAEIVRYAHARGIAVIPSLDSPGHMAYIVKKYLEHEKTDIGNYFHKDGQVSIVAQTPPNADPDARVYSMGIDIANPLATAFVHDLYTEFGTFFRALGCTAFDIGGDELLGWGDDGSIDPTVPKWSNLDHWQALAQKKTGDPDAVAYDAFLLYMNEIAALLRSLGYTSVRMWNDDAYRGIDTGWREAVTLDPSIEIQFWSPHTNGGENTAQFYLDRGHNLYNFCRPYTYYTLYPDRDPCYVTPEAIEAEWTPYLFAPDHSQCTTNNTYIFPPFREGNRIPCPNEKVRGAGFCLWTDTPAAQSEDALLDAMRPYFTAIAKKTMAAD